MAPTFWPPIAEAAVAPATLPVMLEITLLAPRSLAPTPAAPPMPVPTPAARPESNALSMLPVVTKLFAAAPTALPAAPAKIDWVAEVITPSKFAPKPPANAVANVGAEIPLAAALAILLAISADMP